MDNNSMEQVRELLFGNQLKEIDTNNKRENERLQREINDLKESVKTRFESLENFMQSESASLLSRLNTELKEVLSSFKDEQSNRQAELNAERKERAEAATRMAQEFASGQEALERKLTGLSASLESVEKEIRKLMLTETGTLTDKMEERYQDALGVINETAEQIRNDMVYRSALSNMLTEVAVKLSGMWTSDLFPTEGKKVMTEGGKDA
jgi:uncharacterized membrane-anchored protein YhcB (DUF1043 family)